MNSPKDKRPTSNTEHNPNMDPDPTGDPDLDQGGGVQPGATPPESNAATASPAHPPDRRPPRSTWVIIGAGAVVAIIVFVFVAYIVGLLG